MRTDGIITIHIGNKARILVILNTGNSSEFNEGRKTFQTLNNKHKNRDGKGSNKTFLLEGYMAVHVGNHKNCVTKTSQNEWMHEVSAITVIVCKINCIKLTLLFRIIPKDASC